MPADLPELLQQIADACGIDVAMKLVEQLAGQKIWLGAREASPALRQALGDADAEKVRAALAPQREIVVPMAAELRRRLRDAWILEMYAVQQMPINAIVARAKVTRMTVNVAIARAQAARRRPEAQGDLFTAGQGLARLADSDGG